MILNALCNYYDRKPDLPRQGFETKAIPFVIEINAAGQLVQIEDTRTFEGKKKIARNFVVPQGVKRAAGIAANLLWDNAEYALGETSRDKPERVLEQHAAFQARLTELAEKIDDAGLKAVRTFLNAPGKSHLVADPLWPEILETNSVLTFRLNGDLELICQRSAVRAALEGSESDAKEITCSISGETDDFERLHTAIKGVWGAQTSGANIVSFNLNAFNSYGKEQGANAPVGKRAAFAYTTALNYLLSKESAQRLQVGDASTVFWSEKHTDLEDSFADLFDEPPKDNPAKQTDAIKALFKAPQTGVHSDEGGNTRFYVLGLAPNAARISVRFWQVGTVAEMSIRIRQHFEDLEIIHANFEKPYLSIFRLLVSTATQGKSENIPPNLAGELMRAILAGLPYPKTLLQAAVRRICAEQAKKDERTGKPIPNVSYPRAALIKACLNRQARYSPLQEKEIAVSLDPNNKNSGYRLGRFFAVLEKIQEEAQPNINATIRDRYYGAASSTPLTVFSLLIKLSKHHLAKLEERSRKILYRAFEDNSPDDYMGKILNDITDFPAHLSLADQGRFAIGYYHQRQAFFTKSESTTKGE
jgi:CRISPR-associated protein Csd1